MGWKSTIDLTREEALAIARCGGGRESMDDETLTELIEVLRGGEDHGYNYRIV